MVAPIDYTTQVGDPFAQALQGYKIGAGIVQAEQERADIERQQLAQKQYQQAITRLMSPDATAKDYENVMLISNKDQAENIRKVMESRDARANQATLKQMGNVALSLATGNTDVGVNLLKREAEAARNSGDQMEANYLEQMAEQAKKDPKNIAMLWGGKMTLIPGGKDYLDNVLKAAKAPSEIGKAESEAQKAKVEADFAERLQQAGLDEKNWNVKNLQSQISDRSARLNLDRQTTAATVAEKMSSIQKNLNDIPADTRKLINEAAVTAATSKQSADQFNDLAKRLEAEGGGYGAFSSASDFLKKGVGFQGGMTQLRQEYIRLRNTAAIKSLPPGPATDKDISLALKGFPGENASASDLSSFLRGMAKLQDIDASVANAKTDWLAQNNGTLTRAKNTFVAGDYSAKQGETFNDFSQRVVQDVSKRYQPGQQSSLVQQIPTDRNPAPMAAQQDIRSQADAILRGGR